MGERADRVTSSEPFSDIRASGGYASLSPHPPRPPDRPAPTPSGSTVAGGGGTESIEAEIDQTRAELGETIEAIQDRLDPDRLTSQAVGAATEATGQARDAALVVVDHTIREAKAAVRELADQAKAEVRDATIGKVGRMATTTNQTAKGFGSGIVSTVKQNPGPAALTALGIGWLIASGKSGGTQQSTASAPQPATAQSSTTAAQAGEKAGDLAARIGDTAGDLASQAQATTTSAADQIQTTTGQIASQAQDAAGEVAGQVGEAASGVASGIGGAVDGIATGVGQAASGVASGVEGAAGWIKQQARQSGGRARRLVIEKPLPVGIAAVALGGAAALAVPKSPRENQLLGEARDKLVTQVETSTQGVIEKVQHVAEEAGEAAAKEAKYQGLAAEA